MKAQAALEYLFLATFVLMAISVIVGYSTQIVYDSNNENYIIYDLNEIRNAIADVGFMGYPARKTVNIIVPPGVEENQTYIMNNSVNYGLYTSTGLSDLSIVTDYCVTGNLPTQEGTHYLKVVPFDNCVVLDSNDISLVPNSIYIYLTMGENKTIDFNFYNMQFYNITVNLTASSSLENVIDLNLNQSGNQYSLDFGEIQAGEFNSTTILFIGYDYGIYVGNLTVNNSIVPVTVDVSYTTPSINYTTVSEVNVYINEYVCFNASVTQGSYPINDVWIELSKPVGCWAKNGICDSSCQYNSITMMNYYTDPGCSSSCDSQGTIYTASGACSSDGSGDCYTMSSSSTYYTSCTQDSVCNASCSGTPTPCAICPNCSYCGCDYSVTQGGEDVWSEDFSTNTDWATWDPNGFEYVTNPTYCTNDANDKCLNVNDVNTGTLYLYKQSSEDLSSCDSGSAWFYIGNVRESGNIDPSDCVYVAFSDDGGASWGTDNLIFCNDNPQLTYNITIPDSYLTSNFRVRIRANNFQSNNEEFFLDDFLVHCYKSSTNCSGTPTSCDSYNNETACSTCGCSWSEYAWNWTLGGVVTGYSSYDSCTWKSDVYETEILYLSDTGASCSGTSGDGIYGLDYQMTALGNYTLISGYVNDTLGTIDSDVVNTTISVYSKCSYEIITNNQTEFNLGQYGNTFYNVTSNLVTLSNNNLTGTYVSEIFNSYSTLSNWIQVSWNDNINTIDASNIEMKLSLDETSGTTFYDESGNGNNATCTITTCPTLGVSGKIGTALEFDGINDVLIAPNIIAGNFTIEMWIKSSVSSPTGTQCYQGDGLFWSDEGGVMTDDIGISLLNNRVCFFTGNPDTSITGTTDMADGEWHHLVLTRDMTNGIKTIYVDGSLEATGTTNNNLLDANPYTEIGADVYDSLYFDGIIDYIVVRGEVLSPQQIEDEYENGFKTINMSVMSCDDSLCNGETWSTEYTNNSGVILDLNNQYFRYKFNFNTELIQYKPELYNVTINYQKPCE